MKKIVLFITTYERPDMLLQLLKQVNKLASGYQLKLYIHNDRSLADYSQVIAYLKRYFGDFYYYHDTVHRGKQRYWEIINMYYEPMRAESFDYFIQIPDDIRLVDRFFDRAVQKIDAIKDNKLACLNILNDFGRNGKSFWVKTEPKTVKFGSYTFIKQGWVDMAYICKRSYFEYLDYRIDKVDLHWSGTPGRSSGVGMQISRRLHASGASIYQVNRSLLIHGMHDSMMHPLHRKQTPLISNHMKDKIYATMATMPSRDESLRETVSSLLPQVDEIHIYMNDFEDKPIPAFLNNTKIKLFMSHKEIGDLGDAGKFYTVDDINGYHFTVDDDLIYPPDYVSTLVYAIEQYKRKYVVGVHGRIFGKLPVKSYYHGHTKAFSCLRYVKEDAFVHVLGTGAQAYHTDTIKMNVYDFEAINMADVWFSVKANNNNVPLLLLKHAEGWIKESKKYDNKYTIYENCHRSDTLQTQVINETKWRALRSIKN